MRPVDEKYPSFSETIDVLVKRFQTLSLKLFFCFIKYSCINASLNPTMTPPKVTMTTNNQKSVKIGTTPVQIPIIPKLRLNWSIWSHALLNPGAKIDPKRSPIALPVNIQLTFSGSVATFCDKTGSVGPVIDYWRIKLCFLLD